MTETQLQKKVFKTSTIALLFTFLAIALILPLIQLLLYLGKTDLKAVLSNPQVGTAIFHSVKAAVTSTAFSVFLAGVSAWCIQRSNIRFKNFFHILLVLPMLIPSISHGTGLVILLGSNGSLTRFLGLSKGIYGFWGIVLGSMMYAFPLAYLMITDILKYENNMPYEAAEVLGIPGKNRFLVITVPYMWKPLISILFATFTTIITDYGVPITVGGMYKTLPVLMYEEVIGRLDFGKGSVFGTILLMPAIVAFLIDSLSKNKRNSNAVLIPRNTKPNKIRDLAAYFLLVIISVCVIAPIISFIPVALSANYPIDKSFTLSNVGGVLYAKRGLEYLKNSLVIALFVSSLGVALSFISAYFTARFQGICMGILHLLSIVSLAIPGIVLGISYVLFFNGSFIYGTFAIMIIVNVMHFFASPYLMIYNSLGKINPNLEAVGDTLGINTFHLLKDIVVPQLKETLLEAFSYFFVNSMITISAVAFLANRKTKPFSLMLTEFDASQTLLAPTAVVSFFILIINLMFKGMVYAVRQKNKKGGRSVPLC